MRARLRLDIKTCCAAPFGDWLWFADAYFSLGFVDSGREAEFGTGGANNVTDLKPDINRGDSRESCFKARVRSKGEKNQ